MDRWYWCNSSLTSGEVVSTTANGIRLYDGDKKTGYDDGRLTLTNHRLLWRHENQSSSLGLNLSLVVLVEEEAGGFTSSPKLLLHLAQPPHTQPAGPVAASSNSCIKLSFKQGGCSSFHQALQKNIGDREWEKTSSLPPNHGKQPVGKTIHRGILGIERAIQAKQDETNQNISRAFEDLKNLMGLAKDMVSLSRSISNRIKERSGEVSADDTTQFRSYLLSLGIDDPVTREAFGSATRYHHHLAKEIAQALENPVKEAGGVMLLSEVYCRINRARGLELLSPDDVMQACHVMNKLGLSLNLHTFESGVQVVQITGLDQEKVIEATVEVLNCHEVDGVSAGDLARDCGMPLLLARERLLQAEQCAKAVRDESNEGLRFFPNLFFSHS
ncbi:vacuolar protein-sorting-associated protein 36 isoform X1 [Procambarus clarkii]|uniref:vacuolar protein-sorting-associated protein 36 isoform X1 n=1 Tax=Procambarus clarkii TaxID=6728 RepID=UPI001E675E9C|nr:vacuolar protein-sorting-associated protein 36-like isoform X1 [Procambarus clarkii]XP_045602807.1 vacuolar protein-sorting-associated protein 36-like isoform X1 [Procambarus clarkii]XP_045602808.1 vacuolar protein-sorting-associated protein 36-like isoform X1 [Procambarus clarkii]XP_045602809.1 vacuolar protein-sorting-associated protein 36-like isoform X1 [Procambarus clarkii]